MAGKAGGRARKTAARKPKTSAKRTLPESWPAAAIESRRLDALVPYARNARTHSPAQVKKIAASIREWGWTNPVLVDGSDGIIAGHGRVLAAEQLGIVEVPVVVARGWSEAQRRAYVLADNRLALDADWDGSLLDVELGELGALDFDLDLIGFDSEDLAALMSDGDGSDGSTKTSRVRSHVRGERVRALEAVADALWKVRRAKSQAGHDQALERAYGRLDDLAEVEG